jgi:hypothetical protein
MVARSGISTKELYSIPAGVTSQELHERFGARVSSVTAASGRLIDVVRIHRQVGDFKVEHEVGYFAFPFSSDKYLPASNRRRKRIRKVRERERMHERVYR